METTKQERSQFILINQYGQEVALQYVLQKFKIFQENTIHLIWKIFDCCFLG
jgi:hypothetical protein